MFFLSDILYFNVPCLFFFFGKNLQFVPFRKSGHRDKPLHPILSSALPLNYMYSSCFRTAPCRNPSNAPYKIFRRHRHFLKILYVIMYPNF